MSAVTEILPVDEMHAPANQAAVAMLVAHAYEHNLAVYPIGGGTSLDYGLPAWKTGVGLQLTNMNRVVDYPARDMTITVEAGITMQAIADMLAAERQGLPIDVPRAAQATLGGTVATAWSGPRRYGFGTIRDYVIGISAVDGRGRSFKAGGRVVKNVAGYDFCKLLTGSLGTLGVITQVTLRIKPLAESSVLLMADLEDFNAAERLLAGIVDSATTPTAVELLVGPAWSENAALGHSPAGSVGRLVVGLEGMSGEVEWMLEQLLVEWRDLGVTDVHSMHGQRAQQLWSDLTEFPASHDAPLVVKASVPPSQTSGFVQLVQSIDPQASVQAHAGNGIVIARFAQFEAADISRSLIGRLQPAARKLDGSAVILSSTLSGLTRPAVWGGATPAVEWMRKVKRQFDPKDVLNPGRFVFDNF